MEDSEVHRFLDGKITYAKEEGGHKIYNIGRQKERQEAEQDFRVFSIGRRNPTASSLSTKCVLLLGETGAGKTTFFNAVLNYLFGVKFDDPFRLQIEDEVEEGRHETYSCTEDINVYTVHYQEGMKHKYNFVFIDTPGLGDTREEKETHTRREDGEEKLMKKMESLFGSDFGVDDLHCLGIVGKGNTNRIVEYQREILEKIKSMLGKYVEGITHVFATFALERVSFGAVVKKSGISFKEMFKFDNGSLFCPKETDDDMYDPCKRWKRMTEQYDTLFDTIIKAPPVSIAIIWEKKLYDTCKSNLKEQKELLVDSLATNNEYVEIYKENKSIEQENEDWKTIEKNLKIDKEKLDGPHAHNCKICGETCHTCSSKVCSFLDMPPNLLGGASAVVFGAAALVVEVAAAPVVGLVAWGTTLIGLKAESFFRENIRCGNSDCQHFLSRHVIKQEKKTKRYEKKEKIDMQKMKKYEAAVSNKSEANQNLIEGKQKAESSMNKLSEYTVNLLSHGKRIHKLNKEGFDYMEDINCYLDGLQGKDQKCNPLKEVAEKNIVHVLKEAMKKLDSSTTEQDCNNHGFVEKMLSEISEHMEAE